MSQKTLQNIRYDIMLSLYRDLPAEQYRQFEGLHLLKESLNGKTYKAIWATPDGKRTACIILDNYQIHDCPVKVKVTGMTGFAA